MLCDLGFKVLGFWGSAASGWGFSGLECKVHLFCRFWGLEVLV